MPATVTITLDKTVYAPGERMRATVRYTVPPESVVSVHAVVAFLGESLSTPAATVPVRRLTLVDGARTWTLVSDDGAVAVFEAVA